MAKEKQEYDYEGDMAMSQLKSIMANAQRIHDMLSRDTNIPEWVQSKITLAEDYISTAANYMQGEMKEDMAMGTGPVNVAANVADPQNKKLFAKPAKRKMPSFKSFTRK
jgi:serine protease inhibitor